ncbi:MAG TPA: YcxB family protein [Tepidisphaeraceae bacterium]|nr:YcxB family protein [Tepidisphaeraceae bacterium]
MRINFEYTSDDLAEAHRFHQVVPRRRHRPAVFIVLLSVAIACVVYGAGKQRWGPAASAAPDPLMNEVLLPAFPWIMILGAAAFAYGRQTTAAQARPWEGQPANVKPRKVPGSAPSIFLFCFITFFYVFMYCIYNYEYDSKTHDLHIRVSSQGAWVVPLIFWSVYNIYGSIVLRITARKGAIQTWELQEALHRPVEMELTGQTVVAGAFSRAEFQWPYFLGFRETPNLFMLYFSSAQFYMIPKRAIASPDELTALRNMITHFLGPQPSGFPVLPPVGPWAGTHA